MLAINKKIYKILKGISNNGIPKCDNKKQINSIIRSFIITWLYFRRKIEYGRKNIHFNR